MPDTRLILHVKGTESQTTELPKQIVRAGIAQGQITRSQLIWSAAHNAWKQVRELPHLLPSQKLAPAPTPRIPTAPLPKVVEVARAQTGPVPRVAVKAGSGTGIPVAQNAQVARVAAQAKVPSTAHLVIKENDGFHPMKWLSIILSVLILGLLAINYFLVDQPFVASMSQTSFAKATVYAHLGAFMQPNALVIHVPPDAVSSDADLLAFLSALARSTPAAPLSHGSFDYVSLTTGWTGHYTIQGDAWKDFAGKDDSQKQDFLLDQVRDASGQSLVTRRGMLDPTSEQAERDKVWAQFAAYFTK